ncbi:hypothetical protein AVEN_126360-1 [Araneus ventricosus]|uniref:Uncharacterized protein n=1 Tax=Araneus ventricosus TaxID=182803 RepID=A0A4Y2FX08_ARAVE|nr:hypothetical protein AVEN_126360-1 [Araneus ventricosus]
MKAQFSLTLRDNFKVILQIRSVSIRKLARHLENVCLCTFVATDDADVHIVKTGIETYEKIKKQVYVIGQGVDIFVLLLAPTPVYIDILMLKEEKIQYKVRKHIVITKHLSRIHCRRSDIRGAMTHPLSEEDREAADRRARLQSSANQYGRKTCTQNVVETGCQKNRIVQTQKQNSRHFTPQPRGS